MSNQWNHSPDTSFATETEMLPDKRPYNRVLASLLLAISAALLLLLHWYEPPARGLWFETLYDSLHVPAFGIVALSLYIASGARTHWGLVQRAIAVCFAASVLGVLSEAAQIPGPRDASLKDLLSDWLGAVSALLFAVAFDTRNLVNRATKIILSVVAAATLFIALSYFITTSVAYIERNLQLPVLVSFDGRFGGTFRRMQHASLTVIRDSTSNRNVGHITLDDGAWPGVIFHDVWPDWRNYSMLVVEFGQDGDAPLDVNVRVHDRSHRLGEQAYNDRFNATYSLRPGRHTLRILLEEVRDAPRNRPMDVSQIDGIVIFCSPQDAGRAFQLLEIRLE